MSTLYSHARVDFAAEARAFEVEGMDDPEFRAAYQDALARHELLDALVWTRRNCQLTQSEVARRMGVRQPTVSGFETEDSDPRLTTLQRYARAVGARLGWRLHGPMAVLWCTFEAGPHEGKWLRQEGTEPVTATRNDDNVVPHPVLNPTG